jgi:RNA polymerase sigma-70 factor (ECF subfamily)
MSSSGGPQRPGSSSAELVLRCKRGQRDAQALFYEKYREDVARTLYRVLGPDADLEDAVQDVFIEVFRSIDRFRGDARITTWLYRVCYNVGLQKLRRTRRRPEGYLSERTEHPHHETPLRALERKDSSRQIYRVLDTVAPKKRLVFILHEILGMNAKEIAEVVGTNPLTVRTRLHYARKEFYAKIAQSDLVQQQPAGAVDGESTGAGGDDA